MAGCCEYIDYISCDVDVTIKSKLAPETNYRYIVTDKFNNVYRKEFTTDTDGAFQLLKTDFPDGFFAANSTFYLRVETTNGIQLNIPLTTCFENLSIQTKAIDGQEKNTVGI